MTMPWGPHKGIEISELPILYIKRLLERIDIKDKNLKAELEKRLEDA